MKALPKILLAVTAVAALSVAYPASVQAVPTTYTYVGRHFTTASGTFTTSDFVTVMLTFTDALPPNLHMVETTPTAYTMSAGMLTITEVTGTFAHFFFTTNAQGRITRWSVNAALPGPTTQGTFIATIKGIPQASTDSAQLIETDHVIAGRGMNFNTPGQWTGNGIPVQDAGSTLSLMTLSLMALGRVARRFQRAAA